MQTFKILTNQQWCEGKNHKVGLLNGKLWAIWFFWHWAVLMVKEFLHCTLIAPNLFVLFILTFVRVWAEFRVYSCAKRLLAVTLKKTLTIIFMIWSRPRTRKGDILVDIIMVVTMLLLTTILVHCTDYIATIWCILIVTIIGLWQGYPSCFPRDLENCCKKVFVYFMWLKKWPTYRTPFSRT